MHTHRSHLLLVIGIAALLVGTDPAHAANQFGVGLHYLRTLGEIKDQQGVDENAFAVFGSLTAPIDPLRIEGSVEVVSDYLGSGDMLIQPAAYGLLDVGMFYGGAGIGIGRLDGEWATNPFYALRAGVHSLLGTIALDVFATYRFQSASYDELSANFDMNSLTFAAQLKFGGLSGAGG